VEQVSSLKTGLKYKETPIGKIPVDWEVVELADICDEIYRYPTYYNLNYVDRDHGVPEIRGELIRNNGELSNDLLQYRYISRETSLKFPKTILREGDFVITVRGTLGKIGCVSGQLEDANITANLMRISPSRKRVCPLWLRQYLLSDFFQNRLNEISSATTIKTIKAPELKAIKLALPPHPEQKKIAEILRTVDEAIERTDLIFGKTRELKRGLMQRLLTRGIGHTKFKKTEIGEIPVDWAVVRLEDICDEVHRYPTYYNINYVDGESGIPEIRGELIKKNGDLSDNLAEYRYISKETSLRFPRTVLREGDFVISVRGTLGKIGYISRYLEHANITANLMRISPTREKVYPLWLKQFLISKFFQNRLNEASSATTIKTIKAPELKAIKLALPYLSEQRKIADILCAIDNEIEKESNHKEELETLKTGLMHVLLTGKLRTAV
jgi:type I restriction enzyme S subunit